MVTIKNCFLLTSIGVEASNVIFDKHFQLIFKIVTTIFTLVNKQPFLQRKIIQYAYVF